MLMPDRWTTRLSPAWWRTSRGRDHEDDVLGDVGGVVADPLEVARDQDQVERRLDGRRDPAACRSAARGRSASSARRASSSSSRTCCASAMSRRTKASSASRSIVCAMSRHPRDVDQLLDRRMLQVARRRLGDVDRQVADPLEVGVDLDRGDDRAQVDGHRLVQRQQREAAVVDLDVQLVDRRVADEHALDQRRGRARRGPRPPARTRSSARPPISSSRVLSCSSSSWKCRTTRIARAISRTFP